MTHIWSKFGFEAVNSKTGRGKDGAELTFWWFSHGHEDLFSRVSEPDPVSVPEIGTVTTNASVPVPVSACEIGTVTATGATAGANGAVPAQVKGYFTVVDGAGADLGKIPFFGI